MTHGFAIRTASRIIGALLALHATPPSRADATLTYAAANRIATLRIGAGKIRFDPPASGKWWLFDASRQELVLVDPGRQEYVAVDEAKLDALHRSVEGVVGTIESQVGRLPPAMRDQMRNLMSGLAPQSNEPTLRIESSEIPSSASGLRCRAQRVVRRNRLRAEI